MMNQPFAYYRPARTRSAKTYRKFVDLMDGRLMLAVLFVSGAGNDANPGTSLEKPVQTIQKAVDLAKPGDTIQVRGGTYRETVTTSVSGKAGAPITISAYKDEEVVVNGADPIAGEWELVGNEVYRAPMPWNYHFENEDAAYNSNQVFHAGKMLELARWPDQTSEDPVLPTIAIAESVTFSKSDPSLEKNDLATFHKADFNEEPARWVGAKIWVNLARGDTDGQGQTGVVVETGPGTITVKGIDTRGGDGAWSIGEGTEFYLFDPTTEGLTGTGGIEAALGRGEWFIDTAAQQIYVRTPTGEAPAAGSVEAKRRTYGFNFDGDGYISLLNIDLFATSLTTDDKAANRNVDPGGVAAANNILIDGMTARYVSHFGDQTGNYQMQWQQKSGLILSGTKITFQNGDIRYSAGSGLSMFGRQGKVLNSVFRDLNLQGSETGMVNFGKTYDPGNGVVVSEDHEFAYNTLSNSPQQGINFRALQNSTKKPTNSKARIHHNLIHAVILRSADSSAIDSLGVDHHYVRIDHNIIYNVTGKGRKYGIYFDFAAGGVVDHNVVYNVTDPMNMNWDEKRGAQNMWVFNNVFISDKPTGAGVETGARESAGSVIVNNIWSNGLWAGGWNGGITTPLAKAKINNNLLANDALFVDSTNSDMAARNYQLKAEATDAINKGVKVPPYDDKLVGLPDIGPYEFGVAPWEVGAGKMPTTKSPK